MTAAYVRTRNVPLDELTPYPGNAKRGDVGAIRASLRRNGQYRSLVVREIEHGPLIVLAGNHTLQALRAEGAAMARCEVIRCDDAEARRINLADNRTSELGTYDEDALAALLSALDGDLEGTGFTDTGADVDLSALVGSEPASGVGSADNEQSDIPAPALPAEPVTRRGDVRLLGPHRILCGDCRDPQDVARLLDGASVNIAFTSPPYASQRKYDETSEFRPIPPDEYVDWFEDVQTNVRTHLADDGSWFVNIKEHSEDAQRVLYVKDLVTTHVRKWGWRWVDELCWLRSGLPGDPSLMRRFKNAFEPISHFAASEQWKFRPREVMAPSERAFSYADQKAAGRISASWATAQGEGGGVTSPVVHGPGLAYPSNVLEFKDGANVIGHSAAFPVALPEWFIKAYTDARDVVFDPFMGSGSTLLAAHRNDRIAYGTEISTGYCDVICRRFQQTTGIAPVLERTGEKYDFTNSETTEEPGP